MSGLGEFDLIDALSARLDHPREGLGIGDDAAAWRPGAGSVVVATTDMLVEGIHFRLDWTSPRDLGWKALAVSLSDLAAMGARPGRGLVSVALLPGQAALVEELYEGMSELARLTGSLIVGGDTVRSPGPLVVNVAMLGEAYPDQLLRRDGARPGDLLALTGTVGASAAGLDLLLRDDRLSLERPESTPLLAALYRPEPRLAAGAVLAALGLKCAIDVSDGVASEAWHLARASRVAIEIDVDRLPLAAEAVAILGRPKAQNLALFGGEDYQLLFAVSEARLAEVSDALGEGAAPTVVGRVTGERPGGHVTLLASGRPIEATSAGYVAF
ncbi:MAG TPA: thiamine-phosphate kinase [Candidatus Limnocylindrales bacterium]